MAKTKIKSLKSLRDKCWKVFSEWVRRSAADWRGYVMCVTCGSSYLWNSGLIHAGHWIHDKLDFDERNVHPQCRDCNYKYNKNVNTAYAVYMAKTYGVEEMERIRAAAFNKEDPEYRGNDYTRQEFADIKEQYKQKLTNLK